MGPSHLQKGCPFVPIFNLPGQPPEIAPFLLTFSSALTRGRTIIGPSHRERSTGAAFVIGMPHRFSCREATGGWHGKGQWENLCTWKYAAFDWVNPDLEEGIRVVQAGYLDICTQQPICKTQAAAVLPREATTYEGFTMLRTMVCRRDGEVVCRVLGCGKTMPLGRMRIHIAFHLHSEKLLPPCCGFGGIPAVSPYAPGKGGGATGAAGFLSKFVFL